MMAEVRGAAHLQPRKVIVEGDGANAFGSVSRAEGLELVIAKVAPLAPLLAAVWQVMSLALVLNDGAGDWVCVSAYLGVLQGGHDGQPLFCLIFAAIECDFIRLVSEARDVAAPPIVWKYVDDGVLQCEVAEFRSVWQAWRAANALHKIALVDRKSVAYVPAWDCLPELPPEASCISELVQLQRGGIELLGGVAEGSYAATLGSQQTGPTANRTAKACQVARGLIAMSTEGLDVGGRQPAWQIARLVVASSLSFDARVNNTAVITPYAQRVIGRGIISVRRDNAASLAARRLPRTNIHAACAWQLPG
jgi:hypothetical protein